MCQCYCKHGIRPPPYLLVTAVEDEYDGSGEEDGDQADREAEDPVVTNCDKDVEGREHSAPHHQIQHLVEEEQRLLVLTRSIKLLILENMRCSLQFVFEFLTANFIYTDLENFNID